MASQTLTRLPSMTVPEGSTVSEKAKGAEMVPSRKASARRRSLPCVRSSKRRLTRSPTLRWCHGGSSPLCAARCQSRRMASPTAEGLVYFSWSSHSMPVLCLRTDSACEAPARRASSRRVTTARKREPSSKTECQSPTISCTHDNACDSGSSRMRGAASGGRRPSVSCRWLRP